MLADPVPHLTAIPLLPTPLLVFAPQLYQTATLLPFFLLPAWGEQGVRHHVGAAEQRQHCANGE
jgi:hypothetical protein